MKKILLTMSLLAFSTPAIFAQKYMTRTGRVSFNATAAKSPEKIEAINNEVAGIFDTKSGDVVFQILIKSFKFERQLMKEHFEENYMESSKYPKADFKGTIINLKSLDLSKDGAHEVTVTGKLTMHGITKEVSVAGALIVRGGTIHLQAKFSAALADYKIEIPSLVSDKVAKEAAIAVDCDLNKM